MAMPTCRNRVTGVDVEESLCNASSRPEPTVVQCNTHLCPPKWVTDDWRPCSKHCGGGIRERVVVCAEESNGAKNKVPDEACRGVRPKNQEPCNVQECPKWVVGEWSGCSQPMFGQCRLQTTQTFTFDTNKPACQPSTHQHCNDERLWFSSSSSTKSFTLPQGHQQLDQETGAMNGHIEPNMIEWVLMCSVSCGSGIQVRSVECMDTNGHYSAQCDPGAKPVTGQPCTTGIICNAGSVSSGLGNGGGSITGTTVSGNPNAGIIAVPPSLASDFDGLTMGVESEAERASISAMMKEKASMHHERDPTLMTYNDQPYYAQPLRQDRLPKAEKIVSQRVPSEAT
uniref:ADAMTS cysteine-rich domain-containing protein n=1 Tax=Anopheles culicifacies TaxID=139723 RepID=A0A182MQ69_9DIPT